MSGGGGDPREGLGAGVRALEVAPAGEERRGPAERPRPRSGGPRCAPSAPAASGSDARPRSSSPSAAATHASAAVPSTIMLKWSSWVATESDEESSRRAERSLPWKAWIAPIRPSATPDGPVLGDQVASDRAARAATRRARAARRSCRSGRAARCPASGAGRQRSSAVSSVSCGPAVVGDVVEHDAEPLVELGRDRRQAVLERQGEPGLHGLEPALEVAPRRERRRPPARAPGPQVDAARAARPRRRRPAATSIAAQWRAATGSWSAIARRSIAASAGMPAAA